MFLFKGMFLFLPPNPMNTMMQRLHKILSTKWLNDDSLPSWRELNCVDTVRLGGPVFAEIREYQATCGHENYLIELFNEECNGESIALIYWANLEDVIKVLKESVHAIEDQETQKLLNA